MKFTRSFLSPERFGSILIFLLSSLAARAVDTNLLNQVGFNGNGAGLTNLDASKITSGIIPGARLPSNIAYKDTDLVSISNAILSSLTAQISAVAAQLTTISNNISAVALPGLTVVSPISPDSSLTALGYQQFSSIPATAWSTGSAGNAPLPRYFHSFIQADSQLIVWGGGGSGGQVYGTGAIYDTLLGDWSPLSTQDSPAARFKHSTVWTGTEMIVWGGFSTSPLDSGARYAPATQSWTPTSLVNVPPARYGHVTIWTGSCMVIFGGQDAQGLVTNAAFYSPLSNVWTSISLSNAPVPRVNATGVWAGDRCLIWGGQDEGGLHNTGGSLTFSNGLPHLWNTLSTSQAPTARKGHSAIWTGQKLLIWGGFGDSGYLNDGAAYSPATDTWETLSATNAPDARRGHVALWTGTEMIVLQGDGVAGAHSSGGAYNPTTGLWRALTQSGGPVARTDSAALWTGSELYTFGGRAGGILLAAFQHLNPQPPWYFYRKP